MYGAMKRIYRVTLVALLVAGMPALCWGQNQAQSFGAEAESGRDETHVTLVTNGWVEVRDILSNVALSAGLGLQMAPDVNDKVNVHLENVPVRTALTSILEPIQLGYEILDGVLIVYKQGLVTRWLSFDYPVTIREGRGELLISAGGGGGGDSGGDSGGGGGGGENQSHVTSTASMDVWPMVVGALTSLVFEGVIIEGGTLDETGMSISLSDADGRSLVVNAMAGLVLVTAEWDRVHRVEILLERLEESLLRQVAIEVKIFEVNLSDAFESGIDWRAIADPKYSLSFLSAGGLDPALSFVMDTADVSVLFELIQKQGDIKVLSAPRITTLNNQKAVVRVVREEIFYAAEVQPAIISNGVASEAVVEYTPMVYPVGVVLDVTPQVGHEHVVTLNVHPTISQIVDIVYSPNLDSQPVVAVRELDTVGTVRAGQTLVIAGLMSEFVDDKESGIPVLKDIPLLGLLFKQNKQVVRNIELVMLLTPTMMDAEAITASAEEAEKFIEDNR